MHIELATVCDAKPILALQKLAYVEEAILYNDFTIPPMVQKIEQVIQEFKEKSVLKVSIDDKIIGSVRAYQDKESCYIGKLMVHPAYQNRGIGTRLLNEIEKIFQYCKRYELFTGCNSRKNIYLYRKNGYIPFKELPVSDTLKLVYLQKEQ